MSGREREIGQKNQDRKRVPDPLPVCSGKKVKPDGQALAEKARKAYQEQLLQQDQEQRRLNARKGAHVASMAHGGGSNAPAPITSATVPRHAAAPVSIEALTEGVKDAPRFGLNAKALIMQAAAAAAAAFIPIKPASGPSTASL